MRIGIVGSRGFNNYTAFKQTIVGMITKEDTIVSGGCTKGPDRMAEVFAREMGNEMVIHKANWAKYAKQAGMIRNGILVEDCDYVIAFWDKKSPGTKDTITKCENTGKYCMVVDVSNIHTEDNFSSDDTDYSLPEDFNKVDENLTHDGL